MKIAVLGASGMLGSMLVDVLSKNHQVIATVREMFKAQVKPNVEYKYFDAADYRGVDLFSLVEGSDWIINAIGAIPQRVKDEKEMLKINVLFPDALWHINKSQIHIATDCVYSGKCGGYTEDDEHDYVDIYGMSKHIGEVHGRQIRIVRCSIIGFEPYGNYSLLKWLLSQPKGAQVNGYLNHQWNGVTTLAFAKVCRGIIENCLSLPNVQHLVPAGSHCKYCLLKVATKTFDRQDITINPVNHEKNIDRTLATNHPGINLKLWQMAGYDQPPIIQGMLQELAEYIGGKSH